MGGNGRRIFRMIALHTQRNWLCRKKIWQKVLPGRLLKNRKVFICWNDRIVSPVPLYNGMVHPCMPYTISGLIWYQGENSVEWADEYEYQLQSMIEVGRPVSIWIFLFLSGN